MYTIHEKINFKAIWVNDKSNPPLYTKDGEIWNGEPIETPINGIYLSAFLKIKLLNIKQRSAGQYRCHECSEQFGEPVYHFHKDGGQQYFNQRSAATKERLANVQKYVA